MQNFRVPDLKSVILGQTLLFASRAARVDAGNVDLGVSLGLYHTFAFLERKKTLRWWVSLVMMSTIQWVGQLSGERHMVPEPSAVAPDAKVYFGDSVPKIGDLPRLGLRQVASQRG
jgi:hypothetical protein